MYIANLYKRVTGRGCGIMSARTVEHFFSLKCVNYEISIIRILALCLRIPTFRACCTYIENLNLNHLCTKVRQNLECCRKTTQI